MEERVVWLDGKKLDPEPSQKVMNHSPDGFNWGYCGSGPAQLALAITMVVKPKAERGAYQVLKRNIIAYIAQGKDFDIEFDDKDAFEEKG
jgi:hypothetical protein